MGKKLSVWEKIKAYRLKNNVYVLIFVFVIFVASLILYFQPFCQDSPVWSNIALALFTSLLANIPFQSPLLLFHVMLYLLYQRSK